MRSGRGARLPGMGAPASPPASPQNDQPPPNASVTPEIERAPAPVVPPPPPKHRRSGRATKRSSTSRVRDGAERERETRAITATSLPPPHAPHAGEPKIQVNPRIYRGIWRHYEQLVDELPRERRRGALTALVNAVLAQHAPRNIDEARDAIAWLRLAESRDAHADGDRGMRRRESAAAL
jgi:hypothetical protein